MSEGHGKIQRQRRWPPFKMAWQWAYGSGKFRGIERVKSVVKGTKIFNNMTIERAKCMLLCQVLSRGCVLKYAPLLTAVNFFLLHHFLKSELCYKVNASIRISSSCLLLLLQVVLTPGCYHAMPYIWHFFVQNLVMLQLYDIVLADRINTT